MTIEILFVPGCPNLQPALDAVSSLLAANSLPVELRRIPVFTVAQAEALRFPGSPTIRINGADVEPHDSPSIALACRIYASGSGVPSRRAIRAAMARAESAAEERPVG